jgi:hypothetical protein
MVLSGRGIPEGVIGTEAGVSLMLYSIMPTAAVNKTRETINRKMANPSI